MTYLGGIVGDTVELEIKIPPRDKTPVLAKQSALTTEQALAMFMERYAEAMKELAKKEKE